MNGDSEPQLIFTAFPWGKTPLTLERSAFPYFLAHNKVSV